MESVSLTFEIMKILIIQNTNTINVKNNHKIIKLGILIFSIMYIGVLPMIPIIGDEINAALKSFFFIETNL
jgi:hypothetical protein